MINRRISFANNERTIISTAIVLVAFFSTNMTRVFITHDQTVKRDNIVMSIIRHSISALALLNRIFSYRIAKVRFA